MTKLNRNKSIKELMSEVKDNWDKNTEWANLRHASFKEFGTASPKVKPVWFKTVPSGFLIKKEHEHEIISSRKNINLIEMNDD